MPGTNALAYLASSSATKRISFVRLTPGKAEDGANDDQDGHNEEVKVIPATFLKSKKKILKTFFTFSFNMR